MESQDYFPHILGPVKVARKRGTWPGRPDIGIVSSPSILRCQIGHIVEKIGHNWY